MISVFFPLLGLDLWCRFVVSRVMNVVLVMNLILETGFTLENGTKYLDNHILGFRLSFVMYWLGIKLEIGVF